jgi:predicted secreted protein
MPELPVPNLDAKPAVSSAAPVSQAPASPPDAPAASSPAPDAPAASSPAPDVTPASSPEPKDPKEALLKAVQKVVEPKAPDPKTPEDGTPGQSTAQKEEGTEPSDPKPLSTDFTQDELNRYAPKTKERIEMLVRERNSFREQVQEIAPFRSYMQENDLSADDLAFSLQALATLRKGDYERFLEQVQPFVQVALEATGRAVPPDLQDQIRAGKLAPELAANMAKQRVELGNAQATLARQQEYLQQQSEEQSREARRSAVAAWEQSVKASDPDYARKLDVAKAFAQSIRSERGDPTTPEDALAIAKEAYERASQALRAAIPARMPTNASPSGIRQPSTPSAVPQPKSLMEAAMQGLNQARARAS